MRLITTLLGAAAFAGTAAAQDNPPAPPATQTPAPTPTPQHGLSDLQDTVNQLRDDQAPPPPNSTPAGTATPVPAPTPTPPPARTAHTPPAPAGAHRTLLTRRQEEDQDHAAMDAAVQRGRLLAAISRAGQLGTQDMLAHVSNPDSAGITGWLAEAEGNATSVVFYGAGSDGGPPVAIYKVGITGGRVMNREAYLTGTRPPLGAHEARMAAARAATDGLSHASCGGDFNVFVVPPAAPDAPIDVYQLSPLSQRGHFPAGGHFRSTIGADGQVTAEHAFGACADLAVPELPAGQEPRPLELAFPADPVPSEIAVFLSLWTNRPLVVAAGDPPRRFAVTGDSITPVVPAGAPSR